MISELLNQAGGATERHIILEALVTLTAELKKIREVVEDASEINSEVAREIRNYVRANTLVRIVPESGEVSPLFPSAAHGAPEIES